MTRYQHCVVGATIDPIADKRLQLAMDIIAHVQVNEEFLRSSLASAAQHYDSTPVKVWMPWIGCVSQVLCNDEFTSSKACHLPMA